MDSLVLVTSGGSLLLHSAEGTSLDHGGGGDLDVLLRGDSDHERWNVNHLLANGDVSLSDHDSGVVNRVGDLALSNEGLESSLHELVDGQTKDVIELSFVFFQQTESHDSADQGISFELSSWVVSRESEELSGGLSESGQSELDSPHFSLVPESIESDDSELVNKSIFIKWLLWVLGSFSVIGVSLWHVHSDKCTLNRFNNK